jgi:very-short-patch-repair endonuclease
MHNHATPAANAHARLLRAGMTDSERRLWSRLRREQLGVKFRRQHPLGHFIADFACLAPKLVIELDGSQHADQAAYDTRREAFFRSLGFTVLRFASDAPFSNLDGVLVVILDALTVASTSPHPSLPPEGEGVNTAHISRSLP